MNSPAEEASAHRLDATRVRRGFDRAAARFDASAVLHAEVRDLLMQRLEWVKIEPRVVLDAGSGTGHASRELKRRYPKALVIGLDPSERMQHVAGRRRSWLRPFARVRGDAERLPFAAGSVDLIFSNLMLPWCSLDAAFAEFRRVLSAQGLLCFTTAGPDTLQELRRAWRELDSLTHVIHFYDMHDIGDALVRSGFHAPVLDVDRYTLYYRDLRAVARDLKATGARNASRDRAAGLTGRGRFAALESAYEGLRRDGRLPVSVEVVFGHAWAPAGSPPRSGDGSTLSLAEMKIELQSRRRR